MEFLLQWGDGLWIIIALLVAKKNQRLVSVAFIASSMFMMRMQIELLGMFGFAFGFFNFMNSHIYIRGIIIYSIAYLVYLILVRLSRGGAGIVLLASAITIFFATLFLSTFIMVL